MKRITLLLSILILGLGLGWYGHSLYSFFSAVSVVVPHSAAKSLTAKSLAAPAKIDDASVELTLPDLFSNRTLLNNKQLGLMIELVKQGLDVESQDKLNKRVVRYAKTLMISAAPGVDIEQRLLALLGNYDTKEQILDILAKFYANTKQYKQAISSLYDLRSMARFDDDYRKITSRIEVLSKKNLKALNTYNYKAEMADFFEFMLANEPDNFEMQMQYAEFEYNNRHYARVEELLSVLLHHPDYARQAELLMQKTQHQNEMIENGVVPVPVEKMGDHYVVRAVVNGQEPVKLIIDTGATLTILSPKVIQNLGLRLDEVQRYRAFSTANGTVQAPVISLESLKIQNHLVTDLDAGILSTFSNSEIDGLLGMNFLNQFAFFIDQKNGTLELVGVE